MRIIFLFALSAFFFSCSRELPESVANEMDAMPEYVDFNFHVRPILSDKCFACHGFDAKSREADLRLDTREGALTALKSGDGAAIVPGNLKKSVFIDRIITNDEGLLMPPPECNLVLTDKEKAVLIKWIEQGAEYKPFWSFIKPEKSKVPQVQNQELVKNEIDAFILEKLEKLKIKPSEKASKLRLVRRVYFDLTGLPPTIEEAEAFVKDNDPKAYEKLIDKLLQSDRCAERLALEWMDVARYADSHGLHADGGKDHWYWRDWVIKAFKENMPYDQFVTWQLAGDMLENPSDEQILATGFHRNTPITGEGGVIDEEFRLKYVFDKTNTTATAFLGLTMECAQCHDHKYDPLSQKDYYQMSAFFNNIKELGMAGDDGNFGPLMYVHDDSTRALNDSLDDVLARQSAALNLSFKEISDIKAYASEVDLEKDLEVKLSFEKLTKTRNRKKWDPTKLETTTGVDGIPRTKVRANAELEEGIQGKAIAFRTDYQNVEINKKKLHDTYEPFSISIWANPEKEGENQMLACSAGQKNVLWRGYEFYIDSSNCVAIRLTHRKPDNYIHVTSKNPVKIKDWNHIGFTYDGRGKAAGLQIYVDGKPVEMITKSDALTSSIHPINYNTYTWDKDKNKPIRLGRSQRGHTGEFAIYRGRLDEFRLYNRMITPAEMAKLGNAEVGSDFTTQEKFALAINGNKSLEELYQSYLGTYAMKVNLLNETPTCMVMKELDKPRQMYIYDRGEYDAPTVEVSANTPSQLPAMPEDLPRNRLGLAKWIVSSDNPLTSRVSVNRYWQMIFGRGIVSTPHDFGNQGALPSHPKLLDWLAVDFMENGWDVKRLIKQMMMTNAYQQSSNYREDLGEIDPENILLAKAPSYRLEGEMIRDNALMASGLLINKVGGPSIKPYQNDSLWIEKSNFSYWLKYYHPDSTEIMWRRSLYVFIRRTSPHPSMSTFDVPNRELCTVKREKTNTPLQALVLMNDPQFLETCKALSQRVQMDKEGLESQLSYMFRLLLGRLPDQQEKDLVMDIYKKELDKFNTDNTTVDKVLNVGIYKLDEKLDRTKTAALAMVGNILMNQDEFYMKR